jgi:hypothetical protein
MNKEELTILREKFIVEFSKSRGWNPQELTSTQMIEIVTQQEYKTPRLT